MTKIPNPYKAALQQQRPAAASAANKLEDSLRGAAKAMAAGAWQSSVATEFGHALTAKGRVLHTAGQSAVDEFDAKIRSEPEMVDENSYEAHWAKFRSMEN